jgi:hypothetical protein
MPELVCVHCEEPILEDEEIRHYSNGPMAHWNCAIRAVVGSVTHLEKRCSCYVPGASEGDPPGMTRRQAADAAVALWRKQKEETL